MTFRLPPPRFARAGALLAILALLAIAPARAESPNALIVRIYQHASTGQGEGGGDFLIEPKDRAPYLSASSRALWDAADARAQPGYAGPLDFDPVSNSQDPQVRAFAVTIEQQDAKRATVAATFGARKAPLERQPTMTVRYELVNEDGAWKIDDIQGAAPNGAAWSVRRLLKDFKG
jgi:hypothetical protein